MHVLIIPSEHLMTPWSPLGGIFQLDLARALVNRGHNVGIISVGKYPKSTFFKPCEYQKKEILENIVILRKYIKSFLPHRLDYFFLLEKIYFQLANHLYDSYVSEFGVPDIIHAHNFRYAGFVAARLAKKSDAPFVVTEHSSEYCYSAFNKIAIDKINKIRRKAVGISAVSLSFANILAKVLCFDRCTINIIPNILPVEFRETNNSSHLKNKNSHFVVLHVAESVPIKNQTLLLRAFAQALKGKPAELKIIGDGLERENLMRLAIELGIEDQVIFYGRLSRAQIRDIMLSSSCFALSSHYETFGVVLIEALSQGLPVISTDCGGPADIVNNRNGILVPCDDVNSYASALKDLFEKSVVFDVNEISKDCISKYSPASVGEMYELLYIDALKKFKATK